MKSGFQLLIVGAACYGNGILWKVPEELPAPLVACVGYGGRVVPASVFQTMLEFYRGILVRHDNVEVAVGSARRESADLEAEKLSLTSVRDILANGIRETVKQNLGRGIWGEPIARDEAGYYDIDAYSKLAIERIAVRILAIDTFPGNAQRFRIDLARIIQDAIDARDITLALQEKT